MMRHTKQNIITYTKKAYHFFEETIWDMDQKYPLWKDVIFYLFRLGYLVVHGITKNKSMVRATALAYTTLLSIVPLIAVMLAFAKAFGGLAKLTEGVQPLIVNNLATGSGEVVKKYLVEFSQNLHAGTLGVVGFVFLILTAVGLLSTIESAFNEVWGVKQERSWFRRFNSYWTILTVGPLFVAFSIGITASLQSSHFVQLYLQSDVSRFVVKLAPYVLTWVAFTMLYLYMPNTRVRFRSAFLGGILAGTLWEFAKYGYAIYSASSNTYSTIYGSLGALPVFLVWLYLTWMIVLIGAEISFASQNIKTYREERRTTNVSQQFKEFLALDLVAFICDSFDKGQGAVTISQITEKFKIPIRLVNEVLFNLTSAEILLETGEMERYYCPAKPLNDITVKNVLDSLRSMGDTPPKFQSTKYMKHIHKMLHDIDQAVTKASGEKNFKEILSEISPDLKLAQK